MTRFYAVGAGALALWLWCSSALAVGFHEEPLDYDLEGWWRVRSVYGRHFFLGQPLATRTLGQETSEGFDARLKALRQTEYLEHHLRLAPRIKYRKIASLNIDFDILEGVVWGDNDARSSLPVFALDPTNTNREGDNVDSVSARRVWLELNIPVGILKVGRQPSHWGLGLLANKGDGLDQDFGEFRNGLSADRVLFATKPLQIAKTIMGSPKPDSNLIFAFALDRIVDDAVDDDPDVIDQERTCTQCPPQVILSRPGDDVHQLVWVLVYKDEKANIFDDSDVIQAGMYVVHRFQAATDSSVWIFDAHSKLRLNRIGFEFEALGIVGESSAISGDNPKDIGIYGGVARAGYYLPWFEGELEVGRAPGDVSATNKEFEGFSYHPDFNVGLLLYEEVLAIRTAEAFADDLRGLRSRGGVWNSTYLFPKVRYRPLDGMTLIGGFLYARAHKDNAAVWSGATDASGSDLDLGYEVDLALRYDFAGHAHIKFEGGYFVPGRALWRDINNDARITNADKAKNAYTVQTRLGFVL